MFRVILALSPREIMAFMAITVLVHHIKAETEESNSAIAMITTALGKTTVASGTKRSQKLVLHELCSLQNQSIFAGEESCVFLSCSNGLGIGIDAHSAVYFENYTQAPFDEQRAAIDFEPSISELRCELQTGAMSVFSEGLSPRSQMLVKTQNGSVRVHSAKCRIEQDEASTSIIVFEGNLTFYYLNGTDREFISSGSGIRISSQSAALQNIAEEFEAASVPLQKLQFTRAAKNAADRVHFHAPENGQRAAPILIAPASYFEQSPARPYEYID